MKSIKVLFEYSVDDENKVPIGVELTHHRVEAILKSESPVDSLMNCLERHAKVFLKKVTENEI